MDLAIAASASTWVHTHAEETKSRVLGTGRNALDLTRIPIASARYTGPDPGGTVVIEQDVGAQTARLLLRLMDETSLLSSVDLRESLHFTLAGVDGPITLCGPVEAFDVAPCVDSALLEIASPLATLDEHGSLHLRDGLSPAELGSLLERGEQLAVPVVLGVATLVELRWPLHVLPPIPLLFEAGEPLSALVERLGSRIALTFAANGDATSYAFVEANDLGEFSITTRGTAGHSGSTGMTDADELRSLIADWQKAIRAGDLSGLLARHADDVVMFDVAPPLRRRGIEACRDAWEPFLDGGPHKSFELGELALHVGSDVAFAHALARTDADDTFAVRVTLGFEKRGGRWLFIHEHHSAPLAADP